MKKQLLSLVLMMLPLVVNAHDFEVKNADGVTIYYNYINDNKELEVTFRGYSIYDYSNEYTGNVVIPEEVTYMNRTRKVTSIGEYAFSGGSIRSVTIPYGVTSIGLCAFSGCFDLRSVIIPNSVTSIGEHSFGQCYELTSVTIPNSVTNIDSWAFHSCYKLTEANIPNGVTNIEKGVFAGCSSLTSITIPNSVTSIGNSAFSNCSSLTSITIPNSVTSIGEEAFYLCTSLNTITIGRNVANIGSIAFDKADIPTIISLIENPFNIEGKTTDRRTFSLNTFNNATLYVPKGTIDKYKATEGWKDFLFIEEGNPTGINGIHSDSDKETLIYDLKGNRLEKPTKGINIINGKKVVLK